MAHLPGEFVERGLGLGMFVDVFHEGEFPKKSRVRSVVVQFEILRACRIHQSLRVTPAMEAGVSDHVWSLNEIIGLLEPLRI
jgi:hypothetical protein